MNETGFPFVDIHLARRLERTEAKGNARFVEVRTKAFPDSGACWIEVAGTYAMFDGPTSPLTQSFGLGLFEPIASMDLDALEEFFQHRGAPVFHEISPLADPALLPLLNERGYQPLEFTSVMFRPIRGELPKSPERNERIRTRLAKPGEEDVWAQTAARVGSHRRTRGLHAHDRSNQRASRGVVFVPGRSGRGTHCNRRPHHWGRCRTVGWSKHRPRLAQASGAARAAGKSVGFRNRTWVRSGHDGRPSGKWLTAQCRAARVPDRLHAGEMAAGDKTCGPKLTVKASRRFGTMAQTPLGDRRLGPRSSRVRTLLQSVLQSTVRRFDRAQGARTTALGYFFRRRASVGVPVLAQA